MPVCALCLALPSLPHLQAPSPVLRLLGEPIHLVMEARATQVSACYLHTHSHVQTQIRTSSIFLCKINPIHAGIWQGTRELTAIPIIDKKKIGLWLKKMLIHSSTFYILSSGESNR